MKNTDHTKVYEFDENFSDERKNMQEYKEFIEEREKLNSFIDEKIQNNTALCQKDILERTHRLEKSAMDLTKINTK